MDLAAQVCAEAGFPAGRVRSERFLSLQRDPFAEADRGDEAGEVVARVRVSIDGAQHQVPWTGGRTLLDALLAAGIEAPYSCREGACSACVCSLTEGRVSLARNEIPIEDDLAEDYIPACRAEPVSGDIAIEY